MRTYEGEGGCVCVCVLGPEAHGLIAPALRHPTATWRTCGWGELCIYREKSIPTMSIQDGETGSYHRGLVRVLRLRREGGVGD